MHALFKCLAGCSSNIAHATHSLGLKGLCNYGQTKRLSQITFLASAPPCHAGRWHHLHPHTRQEGSWKTLTTP